MTISQTAIPDVLLITPPKFGDARGFFSEVYKDGALAEHGFDEVFTQDNHAYSAEAGVLRGLHYQSPPFAQDKLVRVIKGSIYDVAVDIRHGSPTFGKWVGVELSAENWQQLLVPKGFAHAYLTLEPDTEVLYKVTNPYAPECDKGILWNDPAIAIEWPIDGAPILSAKDEVQPLLADVALEFTF
jgi:dTDP-4-dehydrorhamnose 3,5-epimerase